MAAVGSADGSVHTDKDRAVIYWPYITARLIQIKGKREECRPWLQVILHSCINPERCQWKSFTSKSLQYLEKF